MRPTLSIVIVSFNARAHLEACLRSIAEAPPGLPYDVTVVDNASSDGCVEAVRAGWPSARVVARAANDGFAAANNDGIRATTGSLILLLNSDTLVAPGAVDTLVARLEASPDAAVAGPRLVDADGVPELSFGPMIAPLAEARQKLLLLAHHRRLSPISRWIDRTTRRERYVDWVSGAALLVWRRDAEAVGLLDTRYFLYTEDVDFCAAIRARGRRVLFAPAAQITHLGGRSRATAPDATRAAYRRSHLAFYEKHHPRWAPVLKLYLRMKGQLPPRLSP